MHSGWGAKQEKVPVSKLDPMSFVDMQLTKQR